MKNKYSIKVEAMELVGYFEYVEVETDEVFADFYDTVDFFTTNN